jgi:hypothetical protein
MNPVSARAEQVRQAIVRRKPDAKIDMQALTHYLTRGPVDAEALAALMIQAGEHYGHEPNTHDIEQLAMKGLARSVQKELLRQR